MTTAPPLTRPFKIAFSVGSTAESIIITSSGLILIFYNQVRGDPPGLIGIALAAGLVVNAIIDPLIGSWSDRMRSKLGRRHPFMFASILPVAVSFYAVFNPPNGLGQVGEVVWLGISYVTLQQVLSLFHTPHLALGGELSDDYLERSTVMNYNTFFLWIGDTSAWLFSFAWFFRASAKFPTGTLDPARWPVFGASVALILLTLLSASTWFTRSRIPWLPQPNAETPSFGVVEFIRDMGRALSNRSYVELLLGFFFVSMMSGVRAGLWLYSATFFWRLTSFQISFFVIGSLVGYVFAATVVRRLHARFDKRWTGAGALAVYSIGPAIPLALGYFGLLRSDTPGLVAILIAFSVLQHAPYSLITTTINSALADIADENELKYGLRQEGILYSTRTLFAKVDQALGTLLASGVLAIIAFPAKAVPGHVPQPILMGLAGAFVLSVIPGLIGVFFYSRLRVTKATYAATRTALSRRRAEAAPLAALSPTTEIAFAEPPSPAAA